MNFSSIKYFFVIHLLIVVGCTNLLGQQNELDLKYTPPATTIFNTKSKTNTKENSSLPDLMEEPGYFKNVIKVNFPLFPRGILALGLEHSFLENGSFEIGLGVAFTEDIIRTAAVEKMIDFYMEGVDEDAITIASILLDGTSQEAVKPYASGAVKFYFDENTWFTSAINFLEIGVRTYAHNYKLNSLSSMFGAYKIIGSKDVLVRTSGFYLKYGCQAVKTKNVNCTHELYFGAGFNLVTYNKFEMTQTSTYNPISGSYEYYSEFQDKGERNSKTVPTVMFGYVFGFGLKNKK